MSIVANEVLVDSSVVLDLFTGDPAFYRASLDTLVQWGSTHQLVINPIVYAEVSVGFTRIEALEEAIAGAGFLTRAIPRQALFLAGKAFVFSRRRGGTRTTPLPDFFIGAHAAVETLPLITRDPSRVRNAFPTVRLIVPRAGP